MRLKNSGIYIILMLSSVLFLSCQKELDGLEDGAIVPVEMKPKVGTIWTYYYYTYYSFGGGIATSKIINHKAKNEEMIAGEKWLNIVDVATDTTVYLLNTKAGGLYQYTNSNSYLLCKYPAAINDTYNTFNGGTAEDFTVRGVNDTIPTGIGDIPLNFYEGVKAGDIIDLIWYNNNAWIIWKHQYIRGPAPAFRYYLYSKLFIDNIVY